MMKLSQLSIDIINQLPGYIFIKDVNLNITLCNGQFARSAGFEHPLEIIGKNDYELPWLLEESQFYTYIDRQVMSLAQPIQNIHESQTHKHNIKQSCQLITHKYPLYNDLGKVIGLIGTYQRAEDEQLTFSQLTQLHGFLAEHAQPRYPFIIDNSLVTLSQRELDLCQLFLGGYAAKEMAQHLNISLHTVQSHIKSLKYKLKYQTRSQLIEIILATDIIKMLIKKSPIYGDPQTA